MERGITFWLLVALGGLVVYGLFMLKRKLRARRRARLTAQPFPSQWEKILRGNVSLYRYLPPDFKTELQNHIKVFLDEKRFEGAGGLKMTDEIRVTIAGEACILLLNNKNRQYPYLLSIVVYPGAYVIPQVEPVGEGIYLEGEETLEGESWSQGTLVLSWDDVKGDAARFGDGHNVALHEFAHQLDQEDGRADGVPWLRTRSRYHDWARILGAKYEELREDADRGREAVLDYYGASDPAEFFAVATEAFFDNPVGLRKEEPELYDELKWYFNVDPASWVEERRL